MTAQKNFRARAVAADAIRTVPGLNNDHLHEFLNSVDETQVSPNYFHNDIPIWSYSLEGPDAEIPDGFSRSQKSDATRQNVVALSDQRFGVFSNVAGQTQLAVVSTDIVKTLMREREYDAPTAAETRLAAQLMVGISIADAAKHDQVSYETRRNQFKSLAAKMGQSRQLDVVRILLQDMLLAVAPVLSMNADHRQLYEYADKYLPTGVRVAVLRQRGLPDARVIEYGPQTGQPLIILHPMVFPDLTEANVEFAQQNNIRILIPLRPGMLISGTSWPDQKAYHDLAAQCLNTVWEHYCSQRVPLLAMVSSGALATEFASYYPERVTSLTYAATCFSAGHYKPSPTYFGSSVAELALRNEWLLSKTMSMLKQQLSPHEKFEQTVMRIFSGSVPDTEVLTREFSAPFFGGRIMDVVLNSGESIKNDYFNQVHFDWQAVRNLQTPVRFVHGDADSIHRPADMVRLAKLAGCPGIEELPGVGHLLQYEMLDQMIADALAASIE